MRSGETFGLFGRTLRAAGMFDVDEAEARRRERFGIGGDFHVDPLQSGGRLGLKPPFVLRI